MIGIDNLLTGLAGRYVPAGPSGSLTRGGAHVLPTGRNFYALDPKAQSAKVDVPVGNRRVFGNLDVFVDASRPNVTSYFTNWKSSRPSRCS